MNGCFNRPPLAGTVVVQDGWIDAPPTRYPKMVTIPDPMTKPCQYSKNDLYGDPGCVGCHNKAKP